MAKVTLDRLRKIARKIKSKFLKNPRADLKEIIIDVLLDGNTDLKENHIRTLVHIVNNLIFFTLTKELNTTAVRFQSLPDDELINAYADRVRAIKERLLAQAQEKQKQIESETQSPQPKIAKIASDLNSSNEITANDIEAMKSMYHGKHVDGLPIEFSDFWRNFIEIESDEKQASFINPNQKIYNQYRPLIKELEKLGVDLDYKLGPKHIISVANKTKNKLEILKDELFGKLIQNSNDLYKTIDKLKKVLSNIMGMSFMGRGASLDLIYTITLRRYQQLPSLAEPIDGIPLEFDVPENQLMDFDFVMNYIIDQFKDSGKIAKDFELSKIDTIDSYAIDNPHPYWRIVFEYMGHVNDRRLILKQAREIQNILNSLENANNTIVIGGQL